MEGQKENVTLSKLRAEGTSLCWIELLSTLTSVPRAVGIGSKCSAWHCLQGPSGSEAGLGGSTWQMEARLPGKSWRGQASQSDLCFPTHKWGAKRKWGSGYLVTCRSSSNTFFRIKRAFIALGCFGSGCEFCEQMADAHHMQSRTLMDTDFIQGLNLTRDPGVFY